MQAVGKYSLNEACDWCLRTPARPFVIEKRGVKTKVIKIEVMCCAECARRMQLDEQ